MKGLNRFIPHWRLKFWIRVRDLFSRGLVYADEKINDELREGYGV